MPRSPSCAESAIEKHAEWAAPISSSGFKPFCPPNRVANEYGAADSAPLAVEICPLPSLREPSHCALALFSMVPPVLTGRRCRVDGRHEQARRVTRAELRGE